MADATPRQDLRDILAEIGPNLIFGRFSTSRLRQGSYYLIPLLRQIKIHIVRHVIVLLTVHKLDIL